MSEQSTEVTEDRPAEDALAEGAPPEGTLTEGAVGLGDALSPEDEDLLEALRDVVDPELGVNVVDLGLIYGVKLEEDRTLTIDMTLTSAACPLTDVIEDQTRDALEGLVADFRINWVWMPPWGPDKITEDGREQLRALGFNV
jgi:metal-sulfur cluster biosynthetic enzyme